MLSDGDPVKFRILYFKTEIGLGLFLYFNKLKNYNEKRNEEIKLQYKLTFMQMDWFAKCFAGADTKLLEKFESEIKKESPATEEKKARTLEDENKLIEQFKNVGLPINFK